MIEQDELLRTLRRCSTEELMAFIDEQPAVLDQVFGSDDRSFNILTMAVGRNEPMLVRALLERGVKPVARESLVGSWLGAGGYDEPPSVEILQLLVEQGIEFPVQDQRSSWAFIGFSMESLFSRDNVDVFK
ncbi:MAG: hypothetical protein ACPHXW_10085, partial [Marinobacterium sp.]